MEDIPLGFILILFGFFFVRLLCRGYCADSHRYRVEAAQVAASQGPAQGLLPEKGIAGFSDLFKYARMQSGRFFTFLVRKSDCFCKFARLYADETNIRHIDFRPASAVLRLLGGGGHPSRTAPEDRLVS